MTGYVLNYYHTSMSSINTEVHIMNSHGLCQSQSRIVGRHIVLAKLLHSLHHKIWHTKIFLKIFLNSQTLKNEAIIQINYLKKSAQNFVWLITIWWSCQKHSKSQQSEKYNSLFSWIIIGAKPNCSTDECWHKAFSISSNIRSEYILLLI